MVKRAPGDNFWTACPLPCLMLPFASLLIVNKDPGKCFLDVPFGDA